MKNHHLSKWIVVVASVVVVIGMIRASTNRYVDRRNAVFAAQAAERQRLGLTDNKALFAQYPTPEITLCQPAHVAPGGTVEAIVRGKFSPGSQFLFENDDVDVVKENATTTEYRATVKAAPGVGPSYAQLHVFTAVSGGNAACTAVYIGGRYEWNFTAPNGWRIKVHPKGDPFPKDGSSPIVMYAVEFYRGSETKPFEVRDLRLGLGGPLYGGSYSGSLEESQGGATGGQNDMQAIMQKLTDPKLSDQERNQLLQRMVVMQQQMAQQQQSALQNMTDPNYLQQEQKKQAEFGCQRMQFSAKADAVDGQISCGQKVGNLAIQGSRRFVGP